MKPVIGLSSYGIPAKIPGWTVYDTNAVPNTYISSIVRSGGHPIIIPSFDEMLLGSESLFRKLDGLVLIGGTDLNPELYNETRHIKSDQPDQKRDNMEAALLKYVLKHDIPFLGICRGMQLLNILSGGSLHQHLPDINTHGDIHLGINKIFSYHEVYLNTETKVGRLLGEKINVPSSHHQGIKDLGKNLVVSGKDENGLIEAIERDDKTFCVGVQWHPEESYERNRKLFDELINMAKINSVGSGIS